MRPNRSALAIVLVLCAALAACSRPSTQQELRDAIDAYRAGPPQEGDEARIEALFARLDAEIAAARAEAAAETGEARAERQQAVDALAAERRELYAAFVSARFARLGDAAGDALRSAGEALGKQLEDAGRKLRDASRPPPDAAPAP
jgi:hypothetical protein